jgi:hypothetical protein
MEFRCSNQPLADGACDALGLGLFSNHWQEQLKSLAPAVASTATDLLQQREFKAKPGELISLTLPGEHPALLLVAGLGEPENFDGYRNINSFITVRRNSVPTNRCPTFVFVVKISITSSYFRPCIIIKFN